MIVMLYPYTVDCFPPDGCLNGGKCISYSKCSCPTEWDGDRCEICEYFDWIALACFLHCYNNIIYLVLCGNNQCVHGRCNEQNECVCNAGWEGGACEKGLFCCNQYTYNYIQ